MSIVVEDDVLEVGEEPTKEDVEQVKWAEETLHNASALLRENFKQFITLNSALLAGSAALLNQLALSKGIVAIGMLCLLVSLGASLVGIFPRETSICPYKPCDIRAFREGNLRSRRRCLVCAGGSFLLGLTVFATGLFFR